MGMGTAREALEGFAAWRQQPQYGGTSSGSRLRRGAKRQRGTFSDEGLLLMGHRRKGFPDVESAAADSTSRNNKD